MRVRVESIGCRLNIGEMESLARLLCSAGHRVVASGEPADLCIFNTCTVTSTAARKSRQLIRQIRRNNPGAAVVVTGCYSELEAGAASALGADLVVSNRDKDRLPEILADHNLLNAADVGIDDSEATGPELPKNLRTRAFLKVQDGCDNACTFCIVTIARGPGRSRSPDQVVAEVKTLVDTGYREVVLSGVHLGSFGHDLGGSDGLRRLVRRILQDTKLQRLRLSSLEPWDLDTSFFDLFSEPRLLPHLHLPLQSGCDATLRRMARRITCDEFRALVESARSRIPDLSVSTDVMVGFPGETDEEFETSLQFVEDLDFARLHIFRYSKREGTRAASLTNQIRGPVAAGRSRRLHELAATLETSFNRRFVGRCLPVLWETSEPYGEVRRWSGLTPNYVRVVAETPTQDDRLNQITSTKIVNTIPGGVFGEIDGSSPPILVGSKSVGLPVVDPVNST